MSNKIGRNQPCPCGSGNKYKKCCLIKRQEQMKQQREVKKKVDEMLSKKVDPVAE